MADASPARCERWGAIVLFAFGVCLALGSTGELVVAFAPGLLPDGGVALAELHRSRVVATWVVVQNLVTLPLGIVLARGARGMLRRDPYARSAVRRAGLVLIAMTIIGQIVLAFALYPELLSSSGGTQGLVWMISLAAAGGGVAFMGAVAVVLSRSREVIR